MRAFGLALLLSLPACGGSSSVDGGTTERDALAADAPRPDAPLALDAGPDGEPVGHDRELRAVWVASVFRLDFPSAAGLSEAAIRAELAAIVETSAAAGLNAIYFQVRPESDALYASSIEPWSRFLTGTQGRDPGYDPLALLIELAAPRGIEVHAWINPLRGLTTTAITVAPNHVSRTLADAAIAYDGGITMDPSDPRVQAHVVEVVVDLVSRYDVDGVVFDDYFYPYPDDTRSPFPDDGSYAAYTAAGGSLGRSDWRRDNVNRLIAAVAAAIEEEEPWVRFGVSPFGIYRPGMPPGVVGLDAYETIACDPLAWIAAGSVDYVAPQLYWPTTSSGQPFGDLIAWWADQGTEERPVLATLGPYRLGSAGWSVDELALQVELSRAEAPAAAGQTWFRYENIASDAGLRARMAALYAVPARPPRVPGREGETLAAPTVTGAPLAFSHPRAAELAGYLVYREDGALEAFVPRGAAVPALASGRYRVSAIDRGGLESLGAPAVVP
jgi:uncharacterized lipoprotein YddW (UPF0748 family)